MQGIPCAVKAKYLGVDIALDIKDQIRLTKATITKTLPFLKRGLRYLDSNVLEHILVVLARSILTYHGTPLVVAGIWDKEDIKQLEAGLYRGVHSVSNEISNEVLLNVLQNAKPVWDIVKNLAAKCKAKSTNNRDLRDYFRPMG